MTAPMPKDNEVDEKVMPVAWIVTNGGESCEPWLEYEQSEVDALPAVCIAEPLYSAATVAELLAKADAAERRVRELEAALLPAAVLMPFDLRRSTPTGSITLLRR